MADLSLDEYIGRKSTNNNSFGQKPNHITFQSASAKTNLSITKNVRPQSGTFKALQQKPFQSRTQFNVVGIGKGPGFDARQKLRSKSGNQPVQDARQKLQSKSQQVVDARIHIKNKQMGVGQGTTELGQTAGMQDMRIKLQNAKKKTVDARQKIQERQQQKKTHIQPIAAPGVDSGPPHKVTITGFGRVASQTPQTGFTHTRGSQIQRTVSGPPKPAGMQFTNFEDFPMPQGAVQAGFGGKLQKTISGEPRSTQFTMQDPTKRKVPIRKTIKNAAAMPVARNRVGNNIVISPTSNRQAPSYNQPQHQQQNYAPQHQQPAYQQMVPQQQMHYEPPPQRPPQMGHYPQQQQHFYSEPLLEQEIMYEVQQEPVMPQHDPYEQQLEQYEPEPQPVYQTYQPPVAPPLRAPPVMREHVARSAPPTIVRSTQPPVVRSTQQTVLRSTQPTVLRSTQLDTARSTQSSVVRSAQSRSTVQARLGEETSEVPPCDVSPLEGFRVIISNLHPVVTQDDILDLFGAIGALKKVRLMRAGTAEVIFVKQDDAMAAIRKYNNRELDGQPMQVTMTSSAQTTKPTEPQQHHKVQKPSTTSVSAEDVDLSLLHKALFKTTNKEAAPSRPVTFTVKI